jgi:quinol monooxygenase YgiN
MLIFESLSVRWLGDHGDNARLGGDGQRPALAGTFCAFIVKEPAPMIQVVAIITALPGQRENILQAYRANRPAVLAEEGCIEYAATVDAAGIPASRGTFGPDTFVVIEKWASLAALQAHAASPHMAAYGAKTKEWTANRMIHVLEPVG